MSQTLQNQITLAKSMNGIVTLSDGAGTTISNGIIDTNELVVDTMTATYMVSNNMIVPRVSTTVLKALLGYDINLTTLVQNLNYNISTRKFEIWSDLAAAMFLVDTSNNDISIQPTNLVLQASGGIVLTAGVTTFLNTNITLSNTNFVANGFTISPTELGYLDNASSNIQTQLNTINSSLSNYVTLTTSQTITGTKTMNDLLPYFSLNNTSYKMGLNAMQYQQATSANNIAIGTNALRGKSVSPSLNVAKRNIVIGNNSGQDLQNDPCDDNVLVGYNIMPVAFVATRENVCIGNNVAATTAVSYRNVYIGHNAAGSTGLAGENYQNVIIGHSAVPYLGGRSQIVVVGYGNGSSATPVGNSFTLIGSLNCTNLIQGNRITVLGTQNLQNLNADAFSCAIGAQNGNNLSTGFYCIFIGFNNNVAVSSIINSATIGIGCNIPRSHCLYLGASTGDNITYQNVCIAFKTTELCCKSVTGTIYNLTFEDEEYIRIADNTMVTVNLPTPVNLSGTTRNVGGRWTLLRTQSTASTITINAPAGQTLRTPSGTTVASYTMKPYEWIVTITCIFNSGVSYQISLSQQTQISNIINCTENRTNGTLAIGNTATENIGLYNTLVGHSAGGNMSAVGAQLNTGVGYNALGSITTLGQHNVAVGSGAGQTTTASRSVFLGSGAGLNSLNPTKSVFVGYTTAATNTTGNLDECAFLGHASDVVSATTAYRNSTAIGAHSIIGASNEIVLGGLNQSDLVTYPNIVLPSKVKPQTATLTTVTTYNVTIGRTQEERIVLNSNATTIINLPAVTATNIGFCITIIRAYIPIVTDLITINTAGGLNIQSSEIPPSTSLYMQYDITTITITLVSNAGSVNWIASYERNFNTVDNTDNLNYPVNFGPLLSGPTSEIYVNPGITYNPSTTKLNIGHVSTGNSICNDLYIGGLTIYSPYMSKQLNSGGAMSTPLAGVYWWDGAININVTLPLITTDMVGARVVFRRAGGGATVLQVTRSGTNSIYGRNTTGTSPTIDMLNPTAGANPYVGELVAMTIDYWAVIQ